MKNVEQLEALIQTLDADRDKLVVYNLLDTIYVTFKGYKEWKLRNVRGEWTVVNVRSLYNAVYPQPEYIPPTPPAGTCLFCGGAGELAVEVKQASRLYNWRNSVTYDTCWHCKGTGTAETVRQTVATDRDIEHMQHLHEGLVA